MHQRHVLSTFIEWSLPRLSREEATRLYRAAVPGLELDPAHGWESEARRLLPTCPDLSAVGILVLAPARPLVRSRWPLVRLLGGTLNFGLSARRRWAVQGFRETYRCIRSIDHEDWTNVCYFPPAPHESLST